MEALPPTPARSGTASKGGEKVHGDLINGRKENRATCNAEAFRSKKLHETSSQAGSCLAGAGASSFTSSRPVFRENT